MNDPSANPASGAESSPLRRDDDDQATDVGAMHAAIRREQMDPQEGYEPVSLWLVAFVGASLFWGGFYFAKYSANFNPSILDTRFPTELSQAPVQAAPSPEVLGQRTYTMACMPCHQPDGQGLPGQFPPLAGSEWVVTPNPDRVILIVLDGLQGPITVRGNTYNNAMPPWRDTLSDEQVATVVTYVRNTWGNRASAATVEQVAALRAEGRTAPWTATELLAIPE